jgi:proteasome lid subunit RPN8/RPN11
VTVRGDIHRLVIAKSALAAAERAASSRLPRETGGILLGVRADSDVYVADVVEVADDQSTGSRFVLREAAREEALARYRSYVPPDCPFGYVGTWHSHPVLAAGSSRDTRTLRHEAKTAQDLVAMLILMSASDGVWLVEGAVGYRKRIIARHAGRRQVWHPLVAKADVILTPPPPMPTICSAAGPARPEWT